jgi:uncharacterized protein (TIGR03086 family)
MSAETLERAFASTAAVLANVKADQLDDPTPCVSWKVRDVINHVVGGTTFFTVVAETGEMPGGGAPVDHSSRDFNADYAVGARQAVAAFRAEGVMEKMMTLNFAVLPGAVFVNIAATDAFVHGWDLARATGQQADQLDPALAAELLEGARVALPDALRGPDGKAPFGPRVDVPTSAPVADQLAGFLGRAV